MCPVFNTPPTSGLSTPTFDELWAVVAGNQFGPGSGAALSDLNAQAAVLLGQTGRQAGAPSNLTIASALWTQGSAVDPAFEGDMASMFKVRACQTWTPLQLVASDPVIQTVMCSGSCRFQTGSMYA